MMETTMAIGNIGIGNTSTLATFNNGPLTFAAAQMGSEVIPGLLESIRKATTEQREYGKGIRNRAKNGRKPTGNLIP